MTETRCRQVCGRVIRVHRSVGRAVSLSAILRVVEEVEVLPLELDAGPFGDREALEGAEVKVQTAWQVDGVAAHVAESERGRRQACGYNPSPCQRQLPLEHQVWNTKFTF